MAYQLTLDIHESSVAARKIEEITAAQQISREEAALQLLSRGANPDAWKIVGIFNAPEDAKVMDEAMELVREQRETQNAPSVK